ncbi:MAG: YggS family pyridoxal phosphate-dependent enzyme [Chitinophagaceae bacterium]|nr:YggS family pyridoxal phosphate-dependent enzyme [Chitinophagaceae bacterium]
MAINVESYQALKKELSDKEVLLVAVSKTKPISEIQRLYEMGHRDFGENYVQELVEKQKELPSDIRWHFIGHLQRNKVKEIASFVHLIHGVDSLRLLKEIDKQGQKTARVIRVLLQIHIAREETKFGLDEDELEEVMHQLDGLKNVTVEGLMGMATFTEDQEIVRKEFNYLKSLFDKINSSEEMNNGGRKPFSILSMGMSGDYATAVAEGSTMVRIGSLIFGARN